MGSKEKTDPKKDMAVGVSNLTKSMLRSLSEEYRKLVFDSIQEQFCFQCGKEIMESQCYCMRDE